MSISAHIQLRSWRPTTVLSIKDECVSAIKFFICFSSFY
jgi:hypothetical protein